MTETPNVDQLAGDLHHSFAPEWWPDAYFDEGGRKVHAMIVGYVLGLMHSNRVREAESVASQYIQSIGYILAPWTETLTRPDGIEVKVPARKAILSLDGPFSFGFVTFTMTNPKKLQDAFTEFQGNWEAFASKHHLLDAVGWIPEHWRKETRPGIPTVHYQRWMNGAMIYRGPRLGKTDGSVIPDRDLWSHHT